MRLLFRRNYACGHQVDRRHHEKNRRYHAATRRFFIAVSRIGSAREWRAVLLPFCDVTQLAIANCDEDIIIALGEPCHATRCDKF
jgi:hypothetical protein